MVGNQLLLESSGRAAMDTFVTMCRVEVGGRLVIISIQIVVRNQLTASSWCALRLKLSLHGQLA